MRMRLPHLFGLPALLLAGLTASAQPAPRHIPPEGISLTSRERAELAAGVAALGDQIAALSRELARDPGSRALLPDVEVFHKAVEWALQDDTFYAPKDIAFARHLLTEGRERAEALRAGKTPWLQAHGQIVRGYRSKIDGSVQPYGLVVPPTLDYAKPLPLMVWLLGRGETRTELSDLAERENSLPALTPAGMITLIPYGRFCNATKFAGETDVLEALAAVRVQYNIDARRILLAGFSMGGGSVWHLATHYPTLWCAASPGAGFAETPIFTKALGPGKEPRPPWEQLLWRQYEATGIAGNLFNCPTVAYSGEIDPQKEAADLMEKAMSDEGLKLERFIGPQTAHKYHEETKAALTKRLEEIVAEGREPAPREVRFSTYTLRYAEAAWVRIEGMEKSWERADVHARRSEDNLSLTVETKNVTALRLNANPAQLTIDGQTLAPAQPVAPAGISLVREQGTWRIGALSGRHKGPGLTGPVDDAFMDAFVFVRASGKPLNAKVGGWVESELTTARHLWHDVYRGEAPVIADTEVSEQDIANKNLVLWGDPASNKFLARILRELPLTWDAKELVFRGQAYDAGTHAPILVFPNPLNPRRYVVLNSGIDFRADGYGNNALQTPKLPDWAVVDLREPPGPRWPGKIVNAGFFDESWK